MPQAYQTTFSTAADLTSVLGLHFSQARSDRPGRHGLLRRHRDQHQPAGAAPALVLQLAPTAHFAGEPVGTAGRAADGSWLIDLSANFPANGILNPGQSTAGRTITVRIPSRQPVSFDSSVTARPGANLLPAFISAPVVEATAGVRLLYQAAPSTRTATRCPSSWCSARTA